MQHRGRPGTVHCVLAQAGRGHAEDHTIRRLARRKVLTRQNFHSARQSCRILYKNRAALCLSLIELSGAHPKKGVVRQIWGAIDFARFSPRLSFHSVPTVDLLFTYYYIVVKPLSSDLSQL